MTTEEILILAGVVVLVLVVLGLAVWAFTSRRNKRQQRLQEHYGREYDATVDAKGRREGEDDLAHREEERQQFQLRDMGEDARADLRRRMAELQFRFVEDPQEVLLETQRVVVDGLRARGYPVVEDRERALRVLSVDHPEETPPLRALLAGSYGRDTDNQRRLFLDARAALMAVVDVSYTPRDLTAGDPRPRYPDLGGDEAGPGDRLGHDTERFDDREYARDLDGDGGSGERDRRIRDGDDELLAERDVYHGEPRDGSGSGSRRAGNVPPPPVAGDRMAGADERPPGDRDA